jgi:hypothetical protein
MSICEPTNKNKRLLDITGLHVAYPTPSLIKCTKMINFNNSKFKHEKVYSKLTIKQKSDISNNNISQIMKYQKQIARNRIINGIIKSSINQETNENSKIKHLSLNPESNNVLSRNLSDISINHTINKKIINFKSNFNFSNNQISQKFSKKDLSYFKENSNSKLYLKTHLFSQANINNDHVYKQNEEKSHNKIDVELQRKIKTKIHSLMKNEINYPSNNNLDKQNSRLKTIKSFSKPIYCENHSYSKNNISQFNNSYYINKTNLDQSINLNKTQLNTQTDNSILSKLTFKNFSPLTRNIKREFKSPLIAITSKQHYEKNKTHDNKIPSKEIFDTNFNKSMLSSNSFLNNTELLERTANFSFFKDIKVEDKSFIYENEKTCNMKTNMNISDLNQSYFNSEFIDHNFDDSKIEKDKFFTEISGYEHDYLNSEYISVNSIKTHESRVRETETIIDNRQTQSGFTFREDENKNTKIQNSHSKSINKETSKENVDIKIKSKNLILNLNKISTKSQSQSQSQSNSSLEKVSNFMNKKTSFSSIGLTNSRNLKSNICNDKKLFLFNKNHNAFPLRPVKLNQEQSYIKHNSSLVQNSKFNEIDPFISFKYTLENLYSSEDIEKLNEKDTRVGSTIDTKITDSNYQTPKLSNTNSNRASINDSIRRLSSGSPKIIKNHPNIKSFFDI